MFGDKKNNLKLKIIMKVVYIAHPIGGDVENNIKKVIEICRHVNLSEPNVIPFVPYLSDLYALDDSKPEERERGLNNGLSLLKKGFIDEIWLYGDYISKGMEGEIKTSIENGIKVVDKSKSARILYEFNR